MPNNFASAKRPNILERRFNDQTEFRKRYEETIQNNLNKEFIRKVDYDKIKKTSDCPYWYLPYHPVDSPHIPEKVRNLCNAAEKYKGHSLNDKHMSGSDLLRNLLEIFFGFRKKEHAVTAEIESGTRRDQKDEFPGIDKNLLQSFYMDDFVRTERDEDVTVKLFSDLKSCLKVRGFEVRSGI